MFRLIKKIILLIIFICFVLIALILPVFNVAHTSLTGYVEVDNLNFKKYLNSKSIIINDDFKIVRNKGIDTWNTAINIKTKYGEKELNVRSSDIEYDDADLYTFIRDIIVNPYLDDRIAKNKNKYENILVDLNNFRLNNEIVYKFMHALNINGNILLSKGRIIKTGKYYLFKYDKRINLNKTIYELLDKPINLENIDISKYFDKKLVPIIVIKVLDKQNKNKLVKKIYEHLAFYNNLDDIKIVFDLGE